MFFLVLAMARPIDTLKMRLQGVKSLLANATSDAAKNAIAEQQRSALISMTSSLALNAADVAELVAEIVQTGFPRSIEQQLVTELTKIVASTQVGSRKRMEMQNYGHLMHYLKGDLWRELQNSNFDVVRDRLVDLAVHKLGLRAPSEPTTQKMTAVALLMKHSVDELASMNFDEKTEHFKRMKAVLRQHIKASMSQSVPFIKELPCQPSEFIRQYPQLGEYYRDQMPGAPPFTEQSLACVAESIAMRSTRRAYCNNATAPSDMMQRMMDMQMNMFRLQCPNQSLE